MWGPSWALHCRRPIRRVRSLSKVNSRVLAPPRPAGLKPRPRPPPSAPPPRLPRRRRSARSRRSASRRGPSWSRWSGLWTWTCAADPRTDTLTPHMHMSCDCARLFSCADAAAWLQWRCRIPLAHSLTTTSRRFAVAGATQGHEGIRRLVRGSKWWLRKGEGGSAQGSRSGLMSGSPPPGRSSVQSQKAGGGR